ncbi:MAG: zinc finger domain-containing protein [Candidatus Bathyarchaeia archaeon]
MSEQVKVKMPVCIWCEKMVVPTEFFVKFPCPNCGEVTITRCQRCRALSRPYRCPKCGFTGP